MAAERGGAVGGGEKGGIGREKGGIYKGKHRPICPSVPQHRASNRAVRERGVERALIAAAVAAGGVAYKFTSPGRRGVPDRLVVLPGGSVIFAEVKGTRGRVSKLQAIEIARLRSLGARVELVCSVDQAKAIVR